ncbi:M24 family metallopeptidase, partial [Escherichia sp. SS-MK2]
ASNVIWIFLLTGYRLTICLYGTSSDAGYGDYFGHNTGHAIGIEVHEDPRFSPRDTTTLQPGMLLTVEPG